MSDPHTPNRSSSTPPGSNDSLLAARVSRRGFMQTLGVSAAAATIAQNGEAFAKASRTSSADDVVGPGLIDITLKVNGKSQPLKIDPATTLLEALRMHIGLTGSKEICDRGSCGGCSVILDGKLMVSCMMLAIDAVGASITTVEGIGSDAALDPIQTAFIKHDALQCGYCTPGFVVASRWLLDATPKPSLEQIKHALSGNICRCGTYTNVFNAVLEASGQSPVLDVAKLSQ